MVWKKLKYMNSKNVQPTTNTAIDGNNVSAVILVKTRFEAEEQMKIGNSFKATCNVTPYNRKMLDFYISKYNYTKSKVERGIDFYEPVL